MNLKLFILIILSAILMLASSYVRGTTTETPDAETTQYLHDIGEATQKAGY